MPELPEVETICRGLQETLAGQTILEARIGRPDLRVPFPANLEKRLAGQKIVRVLRRGKYLLMPFAAGKETLVIHLGMSGRIFITPAADWPGPRKHDHFLLKTENEKIVALNDARRFGMVLLAEGDWKQLETFRNMGPEPFDDTLSGESLMNRLRHRRQSLKTALLDQRIIAGLGNIYVCEALFQAGLSPFMASNTLTEKQAARLLQEIRNILIRAIEAGGSTLRDYSRINGETGYFQFAFSVYDREGEPCPGCDCIRSGGAGVKRAAQSGRSTFFCPIKQGVL